MALVALGLVLTGPIVDAVAAAARDRQHRDHHLGHRQVAGAGCVLRAHDRPPLLRLAKRQAARLQVGHAWEHRRAGRSGSSPRPRSPSTSPTSAPTTRPMARSGAWSRCWSGSGSRTWRFSSATSSTPSASAAASCRRACREPSGRSSSSPATSPRGRRRPEEQSAVFQAKQRSQDRIGGPDPFFNDGRGAPASPARSPVPVLCTRLCGPCEASSRGLSERANQEHEPSRSLAGHRSADGRLGGGGIHSGGSSSETPPLDLGPLGPCRSRQRRLCAGRDQSASAR